MEKRAQLLINCCEGVVGKEQEQENGRRQKKDENE